MARKAAQDRARPVLKDAESAWKLVLENDRWVRMVTRDWVGVQFAKAARSDMFGYEERDAVEELLSVAYEGAVVAADTWNPERAAFTTWSKLLIEQHLAQDWPRFIDETGINFTQSESLDEMLEGSNSRLTGRGPKFGTQFNNILPRLADSDFVVTPLDRVDEHLDVQALREHLGEFDFTLLQMRGDGWSGKAIAAKVGMTRNNVYQRLFKAKAKARKFLEASE